jgi:hypothetical protein
MIRWLADSLFGCSHQHLSFPFTPRHGSFGPAVFGATRKGTYVACLDCGQEFSYDWKEMRLGRPVTAPVAAPQAQPSFR